MSLRLTPTLIALSVITVGECLAVASVRAQGYDTQQEPWIQGHIMGGYAAPAGNTSDYLQGGWIIDGGFTFWPQSGPIGIRTDFSYSGFSDDDGYLYYGPGYDRGWGAVSSAATGLMFRPHQYSWAHFYGLVQVSVSEVQQHLTYNGSGYVDCGYFCGGYYGGGYYGGSDNDTTKIGWNVGLGVDFPTYWGQSWFIEAQWRRVQTQQPFDYYPVTVGYRF